MRRWSRRRRREVVRLAALLALAAATAFFGRGHWPYGMRSGSDPFPAEVSGRGRSIDGDSLWVGSNEVRLKGIDAPEGRQTCQRNGAAWRCGDAARDALQSMIGRDGVTCSVSERDKYGRLLAACRVGDRNLNAGMVAAGMAIAYGSYWREESDAKAARRGIWESEFQMPRQWREENSDAQSR